MRTLTYGLVVLAMLVRGLLPVGFMLEPAQAAGKGLTMTLCPGHAKPGDGLFKSVAASTKPERGTPHKTSRDSGCAYSLPLAIDSSHGFARLAALVRYAEAVAWDAGTTAHVRSGSSSRAFARGPPRPLV